MRNMSFSLTTAQIRAGTKTVTRRMGWTFLKAGDRLMACEKVMGRRKREPLVRIREIEVTAVSREPLEHIAQGDVRRDGFPQMGPLGFVDFFCRTHAPCTPATVVTRIEFRYVT